MKAAHCQWGWKGRGADFMNICYWRAHVLACAARGGSGWKGNGSAKTHTALAHLHVFVFTCSYANKSIHTHANTTSCSKWKRHTHTSVQILHRFSLLLRSRKIGGLGNPRKLISFPCNTHYPHSFLPTTSGSLFFTTLKFYEAQFSFVLESKNEFGWRVGTKYSLQTLKTKKQKAKNRPSRNTCVCLLSASC